MVCRASLKGYKLALFSRSRGERALEKAANCVEIPRNLRGLPLHTTKLIRKYLLISSRSIIHAQRRAPPSTGRPGPSREPLRPEEAHSPVKHLNTLHRSAVLMWWWYCSTHSTRRVPAERVSVARLEAGRRPIFCPSKRIQIHYCHIGHLWRRQSPRISPRGMGRARRSWRSTATGSSGCARPSRLFPPVCACSPLFGFHI